MKILFLSRWFPYPADNGARQRVFNLIKQLSTRHEVSLVSFAEQSPDCDALRQWCVNVQTAPYRTFDPAQNNSLAAFLSPVPRAYIATHSLELQVLAENQAARFSPDVVIASQIDMAPYGIVVEAKARIFEEVEVSVIRDAAMHASQFTKRVRARLTWAKTAHYLRGLLGNYTGCTVVSEAEKNSVRAIASASMPINVVPNGVDVAACKRIHETPEPDTLVYNGALTYHANFDAIDYFLRQIFPIIQIARPNVKLFVTGKLDGVPVDRLPVNPGVIFTGYLDDVRPRVARSWGTIVPLRVGGGTRLKILESLALGTPVISSAKGAEGLGLVPGRDLLIGDSPAEFAAHVLDVLGSSDKRAALSTHGQRAVTGRFDWAVIGNHLNEFVDEVVGNTRETWRKRELA